MFCPNCGQSIPDSSRFCTYCGFAMPVAQSVPQSVEAVPSAQPAFEVPTTATPVVEPVEERQVVDYQVPVEPEPVPAYQSEPVPAYQSEPVPAYQSEPVVYQQPATYQQAAQPQYDQYQQAAQPQYDQYQQAAQPQYDQYQQAAQPQYDQYQQAAQPQYGQYQQAATYQQTAAMPQAPAAYPQNLDYAQVAFPEQEKKPVTSQIWFKVVIGLLIALALFGIGAFVYNNWIKDMLNSGEIVVLDANNNPTVDALINKSGKEITDILEELDWDFDDDVLLWESSDANNAYYVYGEDDYEYTEDDIENMPAMGGNEPCIMTLLVDDQDYVSVSDVADKLCLRTVIDREDYEDDDLVYLIMENAEGKQCFVCVSYSGIYGLYRVEVCNPASISSGYCEDFMYVDGTTLEDIWEDVTGREIAKG